MTDYVNIYTGNFVFVQRIIFDLERIDIIAVVKDQTESARLAGFGGGIIPGFQQVYIHKDEYDRAIKIVENLNAELQE